MVGPNIVTHKQITEFILCCIEMCIILHRLHVANPELMTTGQEFGY